MRGRSLLTIRLQFPPEMEFSVQISCSEQSQPLGSPSKVELMEGFEQGVGAAAFPGEGMGESSLAVICSDLHLFHLLPLLGVGSDVPPGVPCPGDHYQTQPWHSTCSPGPLQLLWPQLRAKDRQRKLRNDTHF